MEQKDFKKFYNKEVEVDFYNDRETRILKCLSSYIPGKVRFQVRNEKPRVVDISQIKKIKIHERRYYRYYTPGGGMGYTYK